MSVDALWSPLTTRTAGPNMGGAAAAARPAVRTSAAAASSAAGRNERMWDPPNGGWAPPHEDSTPRRGDLSARARGTAPGVAGRSGAVRSYVVRRTGQIKRAAGTG